MNANTLAPAAPPVAPRFDAKFIEEHRLVERYLDSKLPVKGARDLENWCRDHPDYLEGLGLAGRAQATLRLLEATGRPVDLSEPRLPWWRTPYVLIGLAAVTVLSLALFWAQSGKLQLLRAELEDARTRQTQGSLLPAPVAKDLRVAPDRAPGIEAARVAVSGAVPQLIDLHIDMNYSKSMQFRITVDKKDQGRALILNNVTKDSNGDLRLTFNTTGIAAGTYTARIESLPFRGGPVAEGWLLLEVK